ncbi:ribosome-associated translation inhibitor RaiA [Saccharobesus litoralis]|uniref:Ribosome-associated translation inhibitor RaiA n=1 Tax=Saccharobesus litoralis TaxID=2172099 RepID=A0A2S0VT32_9ALTE|nr:ribosome-associated translation inhibitor RaiA [Saccharobesus litoralis]AWB67250.1 ribosome-associated translation inhibitor RaiA [Saccharobesus litoralis]
MRIELSGHHVDVTDNIKQHVDEKFSKLASHFPSLLSIDVIITQEHGEYVVEAVTNYESVRIAASGHDAVMYPAINKACKKLDAALKHRKGHLKGDLHKKPEVTTPEIAHEIIQGMELR